MTTKNILESEIDETEQIKIPVNKGEMIYFYLLVEVWTTIPMKKDFEKQLVMVAEYRLWRSLRLCKHKRGFSTNEWYSDIFTSFVLYIKNNVHLIDKGKLLDWFAKSLCSTIDKIEDKIYPHIFHLLKSFSIENWSIFQNINKHLNSVSFENVRKTNLF